MVEEDDEEESLNWDQAQVCGDLDPDVCAKSLTAC